MKRPRFNFHQFTPSKQGRNRSLSEACGEQTTIPANSYTCGVKHFFCSITDSPFKILSPRSPISHILISFVLQRCQRCRQIGIPTGQMFYYSRSAHHCQDVIRQCLLFIWSVTDNFVNQMHFTEIYFVAHLQFFAKHGS